MHGVCAARVHRALANHVESRRLGATLVEAGFKLKSNPDTVRAPDVSLSLGPGDILEEPDVVPGFQLQVASLFEGF